MEKLQVHNPPQPGIVEGNADFAGWLTSHILVIDGWFSPQAEEIKKIAVAIGDVEIAVAEAWFSYDRPDTPKRDSGRVCLFRLSPESLPRNFRVNLVTTGHQEPLHWSASTSLEPHREILMRIPWWAAQGPGSRRDLMEFLLGTARKEILGADATAHRNLQAIVEGLYEPIWKAEGQPGENANMALDHIIPLGEKGVFLIGWAWEGYDALQEVTLVQLDGTRTEITTSLFRYDRADISELFSGEIFGGRNLPPGFLAFVPLDGECLPPPAVRMEWRFKSGRHMTLPPTHWIVDPFQARSLLLETAPMLNQQMGLLPDHLGPALAYLQRRCIEEKGIRKTVSFGSEPPSPALSVVIPVYKNYLFVEHQFAQFANDPEWQKVEMILVLDDEDSGNTFENLVFELCNLYGISAKVIVLTRNQGFAPAINAGVENARGGLVVLLNSDVFPDQPGWLGAMARFYHSKTNIGALGVKLLYEDGAIQHAGGYFFRLGPPGTRWFNNHYFKGYPRNFPPANVTRQVPLVTGGCLMIDRNLFLQLGGLSEDFVIANYEDSEFCLRVLENGFENWYLPGIEMFHLEGQTQNLLNDRLMQNILAYNSWLQTERHGALIEQVMQKYDPESDNILVPENPVG